MSDAKSRPEFVRQVKLEDRSAVYRFPEKPLPHGIQFIFQKYDYNRFVNSLNKGEKIGQAQTAANDPTRVLKFGLNPILSAGPTPEGSTSIELPFPRTLSDQNNIGIQAFERSFLFERLTSALAGAGNFSGLKEELGSTAKSILDGVRSIGRGESVNLQGILNDAGGNDLFGDVGAAAQYLSRSILPGDLQRQAGQAAGVVANPQTSLAFTGVDLKSYSFTWDLFPSNKSDSDRLKNLIRFIKSRALPEVGNIAEVAGLNRAFLKYPDVIIVNLLGVDESHFVRFKPAMLTNVTVDYGSAGGQISIIKGGKPSAVTLTLSFTELNIHTAEDYRDN